MTSFPVTPRPPDRINKTSEELDAIALKDSSDVNPNNRWSGPCQVVRVRVADVNVSFGENQFSVSKSGRVKRSPMLAPWDVASGRDAV
jgi:hypothetical protein